MAKNNSSGRSNHSGASYRDVSPARLHQQSGTSHAFGGYAKVHNPNGTFRMRPYGK